jgi:hypothetical protein
MTPRTAVNRFRRFSEPVQRMVRLKTCRIRVLNRPPPPLSNPPTQIQSIQTYLASVRSFSYLLRPSGGLRPPPSGGSANRKALRAPADSTRKPAQNLASPFETRRARSVAERWTRSEAERLRAAPSARQQANTLHTLAPERSRMSRIKMAKALDPILHRKIGSTTTDFIGMAVANGIQPDFASNCRAKGDLPWKP